MKLYKIWIMSSYQALCEIDPGPLQGPIYWAGTPHRAMGDKNALNDDSVNRYIS